MVKAVFFDLFETLVTEHETNTGSSSDLAEILGVEDTDLRREWDHRREASMTGEIPDYVSLLREILTTLDRRVDTDLLRELQSQRMSLKEKPFQRIEGEIIDVLNRLRGLGIKTGVISNARPEEIAGWDSCPLSDLMDVEVFSCQVGLLKPDPEIYRFACNQSVVLPEDCIYVGDGGSDELRGAKRSGMKPYWASWYFEKWPHWDLIQATKNRSAGFPRLRTIMDLMEFERENI